MNEVKQLQSYLVSQGYDIKVDGVFGSDTKAALSEYLEELKEQPAPAKPAIKSTAFVYGLAVVISGAFTLFGITVAPDQVNLILTSAVTLATGVISLYGTITRKEPITFKSNRMPVSTNDRQIIDGPFGINT